jgi:4-aminobutyrate aminotransferase
VQDFVAESASGSYIKCADTGKDYLDLACGIGVTSTGHSHPAVASAIAKQAETFLFAQQNCSPFHAPLINSIKSLKRILPENLEKLFFTNSGSEAVDNAVKIARFATGRPNIIVFDGSFHGRTVGAMSLTTSKTIFSQGMQIKMPGVVVAPYPNCLHCPVRFPHHHLV